MMASAERPQPYQTGYRKQNLDRMIRDRHGKPLLLLVQMRQRGAHRYVGHCYPAGERISEFKDEENRSGRTPANTNSAVTSVAVRAVNRPGQGK